MLLFLLEPEIDQFPGTGLAQELFSIPGNQVSRATTVSQLELLQGRQQRLNQLGRQGDGGVPIGLLAALFVPPEMLNPAGQMKVRLLHGEEPDWPM